MNSFAKSIIIALSVILLLTWLSIDKPDTPTVVVNDQSIEIHREIPLKPAEIAKNQLEIPEEPDFLLEDMKEQHCLALAIYGEARGETAEGMEWVAWVVKNRAEKRNLHVCEVLLQRFQFEAFKKGSKLRRLAKETLDGELTFPRMNNKWVQNKIHQIAEKVHSSDEDPTSGATHFWAPKAQALLGRNPPAWSSQLTYIRMAGNHRFYRQG